MDPDTRRFGASEKKTATVRAFTTTRCDIATNNVSLAEAALAEARTERVALPLDAHGVDEEPMDINAIPVEPVSGEFGTIDDGVDTFGDDPNVVHLQTKLDEILGTNLVVRQLFDALSTSENLAVIFGGWARDNLANSLHSSHARPKDLDIVVARSLDLDVLERLGATAVRPTIFGGVNFRACDLEIDLWPLEHTFMFARYGITAHFDRLVNIADFTINALIFRPSQLWQSASIRDAGSIRALRNGSLEFKYPKLSFPRMQVARALIYAAKLELELSLEVEQFVKRQIGFSEPTDVEQGIRQFCPPHALASALQILDRLKSL